MINDSREKAERQEIDPRATTRSIMDAGYNVRGWCRTRGFNHIHFHMVISGRRGTKKRVSPVADQIIKQLRVEGFLRFKDVSNG